MLTSGWKYKQSVKAFESYDGAKEKNPEVRADGRTWIA